MKAIILALLATTLLASCTLPETKTPGSINPETSSGTSSTGTSSSVSIKELAENGDTVMVDYVGKFPDGKIFDSSIESEAKKSDNYSVGRSYSPFEVTLVEGGGSISGFWKGIVGMKVGETKTVTIKPEDAYGTEWMSRGESTVDKKIFDKIIDRTVAIEDTKDIITMEVERKLLEQGGGSLKEGDVLTNDRGVKAKITKLWTDKVTLEVNNEENPFKGKKLVKGTKITDKDGNIGTIIKVTDKEVFLQIDNKANPFYGKKLEVGLTGLYQDTQRITIKKVEGANITVAIEEKNSHPLANKTLIFDLTLKTVKASAQK
jgi:FKBP-type peptidyl-prolyl cis-trans isomerase 2